MALDLAGPGVGPPGVLVFDVNETLLDIEALTPFFEQVFDRNGVMREWFAQLVTYSMTMTLSGSYLDFGSLAGGVLRMVGEIHGVEITDDMTGDLAQRVRSLPPHPDVASGLARLRDAGFRLATLTNSPPTPPGESPLERAGLASLFERHVSVDRVHAFKPAPLTYDLAAHELDVARSDCMLVACHTWDTIGAQRAGISAALVTRPGNAPLRLDGVPQPDLVVSDISELADRLVADQP